MENTTRSRIRVTLIAAVMILGISVTSVSAVSADGALLRGFDVPALVRFGQAIYWPIGIAFQGTNLWYSQPSTSTSDIFLSTTSGVLLKTLNSVPDAGALAWDGSNLWVGIFSGTVCPSPTSGCSLVFQVNPTTGAVLKTIDLSAIFAADGLGGCDIIDGLDFDSATGTLWVSPDIGCSIGLTTNPCGVGFVYNVDTSGKLLHRIQFPCGVAGVAKVGKFLYTVQDGNPRPIVKTTLNGKVVSSFLTISTNGQHQSAEDLAFDPVTFAPNCALWAVQDYGFPFDGALAAYQIACP